MELRIIGDVHGKFQEYIALTKGCDYSIQVGDMGFDYSELRAINEDNHKFIGGNHDNYDKYYASPYVVQGAQLDKDFGTATHGGLDFFFVRGGFSIDWKQRQKSFLMGGAKTYWDNEELSIEEMEMALWLYQKMKPDVMITHECPRSISKHVGDNKILGMFGYNPDRFTTKTSELLEMMFQYHQPKMHFFGHYHVPFNKIINGTRFICLPELGYFDMKI